LDVCTQARREVARPCHCFWGPVVDQPTCPRTPPGVGKRVVRAVDLLCSPNAHTRSIVFSGWRCSSKRAVGDSISPRPRGKRTRTGSSKGGNALRAWAPRSTPPQNATGPCACLASRRWSEQPPMREEEKRASLEGVTIMPSLPGKRARLGAPRVGRVRMATATARPCTLASRKRLPSSAATELGGSIISLVT